MVSTVSNSSPIDFLNQVKGIKPAGTSTSSSTSSQGASSNSNTSNNPTDTVDVSSQILNLLQETSPSSVRGQSLSDLLGGNGNGAAAGVYDTLLYSKTTANAIQDAVNIAAQQKAAANAQQNPLQKILTSYHAASNAYNKTLLQNAKDALKVNNGKLA